LKKKKLRSAPREVQQTGMETTGRRCCVDRQLWHRCRIQGVAIKKPDSCS